MTQQELIKTHEISTETVAQALNDGTARSEIGICERMGLDTTSENLRDIRYSAFVLVDLGFATVVEDAQGTEFFDIVRRHYNGPW